MLTFTMTACLVAKIMEFIKTVGKSCPTSWERLILSSCQETDFCPESHYFYVICVFWVNLRVFRDLLLSATSEEFQTFDVVLNVCAVWGSALHSDGESGFDDLTLAFRICATNFLMFLSFQQGTVIRPANDLESSVICDLQRKCDVVGQVAWQ